MNEPVYFSKGKYLMIHSIMGCIFGITFMRFYYRPIGMSTDITSKIAYAGLAFGVILIGIASTWSEDRNDTSVWINIVVADCSCIVLAYANMIPFITVMVIAFCFAAVAWKYFPFIKGKSLQKKSPQMVSILVQDIYTMAMCGGLVLSLIVSVILAVGMSPRIEALRATNNVDNVCSSYEEISEEEWQRLTTRDKLDVLQKKMNNKVQKFSLPQKIRIKANLCEETTYYPGEGLITINIKKLDNISFFKASGIVDKGFRLAYWQFESDCDYFIANNADRSY